MDLLDVVKKRSAPGILVFNHKHEAIFCNPSALLMLSELKGAKTRRSEKSQNLPTAQEITALYESLKPSFHDSFRKDADSRIAARIALFPTTRDFYFCREFVLEDLAAKSKKRQHTLMLIEKVSQCRSVDLNAFGKRYLLTHRKMEIVELLLAGHVNKEIAARLSVSEDTVKAHLRQIMKQLGVNTRTGILSVLLHQ